MDGRLLGDQLEAELADALRRHGATVSREKKQGTQTADLLFKLTGRRFVVELKTVTLPRTVALKGSMAIGLLELGKREYKSAKPVLVIGARVISTAQIDHLEAFMNEHGQGVSWGFIDATGRMQLFGPGLDAIQENQRPRRSKPLLSPPFNPFSDSGQWMLKMLLNHRLPDGLRIRDRQRDPRRHEPVFTATDLARVTEDPDRSVSVSVPQASRMVSFLRSEGFVRSEGPLELIRVDELLRRWRAATVAKPARDVGTRWLLPKPDPGHRLIPAVMTSADKLRDACVGLFWACRFLGFGFVQGVASHIYVRELSDDTLRELGLVRVRPGEKVDVFLREPPFPESVFQCWLPYAGGRVTDIIQCWLDVVDYPARGAEMGEVLYRKVIQPCLIGAE